MVTASRSTGTGAYLGVGLNEVFEGAGCVVDYLGTDCGAGC